MSGELEVDGDVPSAAPVFLFTATRDERAGPAMMFKVSLARGALRVTAITLGWRV